MARSPSAAGAYIFGVIIGVPAAVVVLDVFCWAVPALNAVLKVAL